MLGFERLGRVVPSVECSSERVGCDPAVQGFEEDCRAGSLVEPDQLPIQGSGETLGVDIAGGVAVARETLADAHGDEGGA
jgi:hypothetical protein